MWSGVFATGVVSEPHPPFQPCPRGQAAICAVAVVCAGYTLCAEAGAAPQLFTAPVGRVLPSTLHAPPLAPLRGPPAVVPMATRPRPALGAWLVPVVPVAGSGTSLKSVRARSFSSVMGGAVGFRECTALDFFGQLVSFLFTGHSA